MAPQAAAGGRARAQQPKHTVPADSESKITVAEEPRTATAVPPLQLVFPPCLSAGQRAVLHEVAARAGLPHSSHGKGAERHLRLGSGEQQVTVLCSVGYGTP